MLTQMLTLPGFEFQFAWVELKSLPGFARLAPRDSWLVVIFGQLRWQTLRVEF